MVNIMLEAVGVVKAKGDLGLDILQLQHLSTAEVRLKLASRLFVKDITAFCKSTWRSSVNLMGRSEVIFTNTATQPHPPNRTPRKILRPDMGK
jgi:hypothetical protein